MDAKTKTQTLRKGKKAWRKNIPVDDITQALDENRERQVLHGDTPDGDFVIDTEGSSALKTPVSVLKTTEILANKSKVPALASRKTKQKVSKARAQKLMVLAGRLATDSKGRARTDTDGLVRGGNVDLWAEAGESSSEKSNGPSRISYTKASKAPGTLKHQPLNLHSAREQDDLVHAGKSYNPSVEAWQKLVDREYVVENEAQMKVQALKQEQERIRHLMETLKDDEIDGAGSEPEEEAKEVPDAEKDEEYYRLSVNERTEVKRKTRTQKNREARHKQQLELHAQMRLLKAQLRDLQNLLAIEQEVAHTAELHAQKTSVARKYKRHSKHNPLFMPLEVKLLDELTNNLRAVKPEGNPFYEHMHKLQMSGKIEARVPVAPRRRYRQKLTEKWSYKQFK